MWANVLIKNINLDHIFWFSWYHNGQMHKIKSFGHKTQIKPPPKKPPFIVTIKNDNRTNCYRFGSFKLNTHGFRTRRTHTQPSGTLKNDLLLQPERTLFYLFSYITSASRTSRSSRYNGWQQQTGSKTTNRRAHVEEWTMICI